MTAILLTVSIIAQVAQQMCRKEYNKDSDDKPFSFSFLAIASTLVYFLIMSGFRLNVERTTLNYAVPFAIGFTITYIFSFLSIKHGPLSLSSLMISCSVVVPLVYGVIFLKEPVSLPLGIGLVLLFISVLLVSEPWKKENVTITPKWILYISITFLCNGICTSIQKYFQISDKGVHSNEFMILSLAMTLAILSLFVLFGERKGFKSVTRSRSVAWPVICGVGNGIANQLTMFLAVALPASFLYPLQSAGGIILTAIVSLAIYKERLSAPHKIGFVLGVLAVILFNL